MVNGQAKEPVIPLIVPDTSAKNPTLTCHRFFAPVVYPEPDQLDPRKIRIAPKLGSFDCLKAKCTLWNADKAECYDVTNAKSQAIIAEYAFNKANDVHIQGGGL